MPLQNALILYDPVDPALAWYSGTLKKLVLAERARTQARVDSANKILQDCFDKHPEMIAKIRAFKTLVQLNTRGAAATESVMDTELSSVPQEEAVARAFLLKKAYRIAAAAAHPDRGGSHDDFAAINAAYRAKDLDSITEFLISKQRSILEQIAYWRSELEKPEVSWTRFRSTPEFSIVKYAMSGNTQRAEQMALEVLRIMLVSLTAQLTRYNPNFLDSENGN